MCLRAARHHRAAQSCGFVEIPALDCHELGRGRMRGSFYAADRKRKRKRPRWRTRRSRGRVAELGSLDFRNRCTLVGGKGGRSNSLGNCHLICRRWEGIKIFPSRSLVYDLLLLAVSYDIHRDTCTSRRSVPGESERFTTVGEALCSRFRGASGRSLRTHRGTD